MPRDPQLALGKGWAKERHHLFLSVVSNPDPSELTRISSETKQPPVQQAGSDMCCCYMSSSQRILLCSKD